MWPRPDGHRRCGRHAGQRPYRRIRNAVKRGCRGSPRNRGDVVGLQVMGFELEQVGYLRYTMELRNLFMIDIEVLGASIEDVQVAYEAHDEIAEQLIWPLEGDWRGVFDRS